MPKQTFVRYLICWTFVVGVGFAVGHNFLHGSEILPTGLGLLFLPGILAAALFAPDGVHSATPYVFGGIAIVVNWTVYCFLPIWFYRRWKEKRLVGDRLINRDGE